MLSLPTDDDVAPSVRVEGFADLRLDLAVCDWCHDAMVGEGAMDVLGDEDVSMADWTFVAHSDHGEFRLQPVHPSVGLVRWCVAK